MRIYSYDYEKQSTPQY